MNNQIKITNIIGAVIIPSKFDSPPEHRIIAPPTYYDITVAVLYRSISGPATRKWCAFSIIRCLADSDDNIFNVSPSMVQYMVDRNEIVWHPDPRILPFEIRNYSGAPEYIQPEHNYTIAAIIE